MDSLIALRASNDAFDGKGCAFVSANSSCETFAILILLLKTDSLIPTLMDTKMALTMSKFINQLNKKYGTIQECYWDNEIDSVLIPDEFLDEERIQEVLDACTEEAWAYVYANRAKYSTRIRKMIEPADYFPNTSKFKLRVSDLTDEMVLRLEAEKIAAKKREFEENVFPSLEDTISDRPHNDVDEEADVAWEKLTKAKKRMTEFMAKKKHKYVPPSARQSVDPEQQEIEDDISACEKEFDECEKRISEEDKKYYDEKKNELFQNWLRQMQA